MTSGKLFKANARAKSGIYSQTNLVKHDHNRNDSLCTFIIHMERNKMLLEGERNAVSEHDDHSVRMYATD